MPPGEALVFTAAGPMRARSDRLGAARVETVRTVRSRLDLQRVLARLAELEANEVLVEAGPRLSGAMLSAGLVDEWLLYVAPRLLGPHAMPLAALPRITRLDSAPAFALLDSRPVGPDLRLRLRPEKKKED